jgi:hypothetical protein
MMQTSAVPDARLTMITSIDEPIAGCNCSRVHFLGQEMSPQNQSRLITSGRLPHTLARSSSFSRLHHLTTSFRPRLVLLLLCVLEQNYNHPSTYHGKTRTSITRNLKISSMKASRRKNGVSGMKAVSSKNWIPSWRRYLVLKVNWGLTL